MAMIGRNAAIAEMGAHRHEVEGPVAFAAWLGVHAALLSRTRNKVDLFPGAGTTSVKTVRLPSLIDQMMPASTGGMTTRVNDLSSIPPPSRPNRRELHRVTRPG